MASLPASGTRRAGAFGLAAALLGALLAAGCDAGDRDAATATGDIVVERSSADGVETVRTVSGSRWPGTATLVQELSVGVQEGDDAYLFGAIVAAWATSERIYVVDAQVPAVRAFDNAGRYLFDIGRPGQGPGEYDYPAGLAVTDEGRIAVADVIGARVSFYAPDGTFLEDWPLGSQKSAQGLTLGHDGTLYTQAWSPAAGRIGVQALGPGGPVGAPRLPSPVRHEQRVADAGKGLAMLLPFAAAETWTFGPGAELIVGAGDEYRFWIHRPTGMTTVVERTWEPVPVAAGEAAFRADLATSALRQMVPDLVVGSDDLPRHKPAFNAFHADRAGRVWLVRAGVGRPDPGCVDADRVAVPRLLMATPGGRSVAIAGKPGAPSATGEPRECWRDEPLFDVFELATGEYLGSIAAPEAGFRVPLFADTETVLAAVDDAAGTVRLKGYRLRIESGEDSAHRDDPGS